MATDATRPARPAVSEKTLERARERMREFPSVAQDCQTLGGMVQIWCADHHPREERTPYAGAGVQAGCYAERRVPRLCPECAAHLEYGEVRRALCPKDPKPSCHACDIHCYRPEEQAWQREVMRYAGPRAPFRGMLLDSLRHLRQERAARRQAGRP